MDETITKKQAIEAITDELDRIDHVPKWIFDRLERAIRKLPSAEEESFEWCTDCKEYDQEAHCCHRWSKMIRKTVDEMQVVRCKDCKYWDTTWQNDYAPNYHYCPMIDGTRRNDFYCAYAERKEETT